MNIVEKTYGLLKKTARMEFRAGNNDLQTIGKRLLYPIIVHFLHFNLVSFKFIHSESSYRDFDSEGCESIFI